MHHTGWRILWGTIKGNVKSTGKRTSAQLQDAEKYRMEIEVASNAKRPRLAAGQAMNVDGL